MLRHLTPQMPPEPPTHWRALAGILFLYSLLGLPGLPSAATRSDMNLEASILRVKPAVALISSEVAAEVSVRCGPGATHKVTPDPLDETGSGFIIEMNEKTLGADFLQASVEDACGPALAMLPEGARKERLRAILADPANRGQLRLTEKLQVHLSSGKILAADVKAYCPAINADAGRGRGRGDRVLRLTR